jgi:hypothetical protein
MRKLLILLVVLLVGCSTTPEDMKPKIDQAIESAIQAKTPSVINQNTPYYSYYLPTHMGRRFVNEVAAILVSNQDEIVLQLDVPSIISQRFYRTNTANAVSETNDRLYYYEYEGSFVSEKDQTHPLTMTVSKNNDYYTIYMQSDNFILTSSVKLARVEAIVNDMIVILRSASAEKEKVVSAYSNKQVINYKQQVLEIFEQVAPESGTLADMDRLIQGVLDFSEYATEGEEDGAIIPDSEEEIPEDSE